MVKDLAKSTVSACAQEHPELHHYTTEAGLRGIINTNALWGTVFTDLNDSAEIHEVRSPLVMELGVYLQPLVEAFGKQSFRNRKIVSERGGRQRSALDLARSWVNSLYASTFEKDEDKRHFHCCITSFCSHAKDLDYERDHGLLSQWRGYGEQGGFCLVFDTAKLEALLEEERRKCFFVYAGMRDAHYWKATQSLAGLFPDLFTHSREIVEVAMNGGDPNAEKVFVPFVTAATSTKHRGFSEEREVRIVAMPATQVAVDGIKHDPRYVEQPLKDLFTSTRGDQTRHHMSLFGQDMSALPIKRIIVGPSRRQEANVNIARDISGAAILITASVTPFIG